MAAFRKHPNRTLVADGLGYRRRGSANPFRQPKSKNSPDRAVRESAYFSAPKTETLTLADTGWLEGTTFTADGGTWTNTANLFGVGVASCSRGSGGEMSGWVSGFDFSGIPSGAYIRGIELRVTARLVTGTFSHDYAFVMNTMGFTNRSADGDVTFANNTQTVGVINSVMAPLVAGGGGDTWGGFTADNTNTYDRDWRNTDFTSSTYAYFSFATTGAGSIEVDKVECRITYTTGASGGSKVVSFSVAEAIAVTSALQRTRPLVSSISETLTQTNALHRTRRALFTVAETETIASIALQRTRPLVSSISETLTQTNALHRTRVVAASIAEAIAYTIALGKLGGTKEFTFTISEVEAMVTAMSRTRRALFTVAETETIASIALKRSRTLVSTIAEVETFTNAVRRNRNITAEIAETETITEALSRIRTVQLSLTEAIAYVQSLRRTRNVATTVAEIETISAAITKIKLLIAAINQAQAINAAIVRNRSLVIPVVETESFAINFGRIRQSVLTIAETQNVSAAISRLRRLVQTIANTTGYTFTLTTFATDPDTVTVVVEWEEWVTVGDVQRVVHHSETIQFFPGVSADVTVTEQHSATLTVQESDSTTVTMEAEPQITIIIPTQG